MDAFKKEIKETKMLFRMYRSSVREIKPTSKDEFSLVFEASSLQKQLKQTIQTI